MGGIVKTLTYGDKGVCRDDGGYVIKNLYRNIGYQFHFYVEISFTVVCIHKCDFNTEAKNIRSISLISKFFFIVTSLILL